MRPTPGGRQATPTICWTTWCGAGVEVSPSSQAVTEYRYDPLERLAALTWPAGNRIEYGYDGRSRLSQVTRGAGAAAQSRESGEAATTNYAYDANGNLTRITDGEGHLTDFVYDGFDRLGRAGGCAGQRARLALRRERQRWSRRWRATGRTAATPAGPSNAAGLVTLSQTQFAYDERNRRYRQEQRFFTADVGTGMLTPLTTDGDGDGWVETAYTYDRNSNLTALTDDRGQTTRYAYDGLGRLSLRTDALNNTVAYSYDGDQQPGADRGDRAPARRPGPGRDLHHALRLRRRQPAGARSPTTWARPRATAYDSRGNRVFRSDANGAVAANSEWRRISEVPGPTQCRTATPRSSPTTA